MGYMEIQRDALHEIQCLDVKMRRSNGEGPGHGVEYDEVFVPHYESYAQCLAGRTQLQTGPATVPAPTVWNRSDVCAVAGMNGRAGLPPPPHAGLQVVLGHAQTQQPWAVSSGNGSSGSVVDSSQQSWGGMHRKLSEFQVALRASEKAREDGDRETQALRVYVSNVETAAAGLVSRVQDLENLLTLSTAFRQGHDAEQLRGKVATDALKEVQKQATAAAQAIAVAREATMKLDKVKRETHAWAVSQEAEIERLNIEAAECRMLYEARGKQIQELHIQLASLQRQLEHQNVKIEDSQKTLQIETGIYQKKYEEAKFAVIEKAGQCDELMQALELSTAVGKAAEIKLEELLAEKKEMTQKNEFLEQKVKELQSQECGAAVAQYDQELRRVRNALGDEKAQLLDDLAQLRRSNQNLTEEIKVDWHEKMRSPINWASDQKSSDALSIANSKPGGVPRLKVETNTLGSPPKGCSYSQDEVEEGRLSVESSVSASGSWHTETSGTKDCNWVLRSHSSCDCSSKETMQQSLCETDITRGKYSQFQSPGASEGLESSGDDTGATILSLKDLTLLAAAQHEIMKLKEINEQLVAACQ